MPSARARPVHAALALGISGIWITAVVVLMARSEEQAVKDAKVRGGQTMDAVASPKAGQGPRASVANSTRPHSVSSPGRESDDVVDWTSLGFAPATGTNLRMTFKLSVDPECGSVGEAMAATVKTVPNAAVSLMVVFPDGESYGTHYVGRSNGDGSLRFRWVVPPQAPPGNGRVLATAGVEDGSEATTGSAIFRIAQTAGCR